MQQKNLIHLFEGLHVSLQEFISNYTHDHPALLPIEKECLKRLERINAELAGFLFLKDKSTPEKFTFDKYDTFVIRIVGITPPQETIKTEKTEGFLGIGSTIKQEKVTIGLHNAMTRFIANLDKKLGEASKEVKEAPEKSSKEKNESETLEKRISALETRVEQAYMTGYEKGQQEGKQQLITYFKERVGQYFLEASLQQKVLLLLEGKDPAPGQIANTPIPPVFTPAPKITDTPIIKTENDEENKAAQWIGNAKFPVVKQFIEFQNKNVPEQEKIIAKWAIFELMLHKHDQPISSVLEVIKHKLADKNITISQLKINPLFEAHSQSHDSATTQQLTAKELTAFYQLTNEKTATYLPADNTASACFGSKASILNGKTTKETTEQDYINNAMAKLTKASIVPMNS